MKPVQEPEQETGPLESELQIHFEKDKSFSGTESLVHNLPHVLPWVLGTSKCQGQGCGYPTSSEGTEETGQEAQYPWCTSGMKPFSQSLGAGHRRLHTTTYAAKLIKDHHRLPDALWRWGHVKVTGESISI